MMSSLIYPKSTDNCDHCVQSFTYIESIIDITKTPQQVQQSLIQYCGILIEPFKQNCINVYSSPLVLDVITDILKQVSPRTICQHIHVCPATHAHLHQQNVPEKPITDSPICKGCKSQVLTLEKFMDKSQTPEEIQKRILGICDILKPNLQKECHNFYTGVGLEMIKAMFRNEDPEKVCQMGNLCPSMDFSIQLRKIFKMMSSLIYPKSTDNCDHCVQSFTHIESIIDITKTPQQVQQSLIQYCGILIEPFKQNCINVYSSPLVLDVITDILKQVSPRTICQHIHVCPATHAHLHQQNIHETFTVKSPTCDYCKSQVYSLEMYVNKSQTPEDIQKHFLKICDVLKQNVKTGCYDFYTGLGFEMIKAILRNEDPEKVCQIGNFCSRNPAMSESIKYLKLVSSFMSNKLTGSCDSCTQIIFQIENVIDTTKTPQQVQQSLIQVCGIFIESIIKGCTLYYSSPQVLEVITKILKQENPNKICQDMHLCPSEYVFSNIQSIYPTSLVDLPVCDTCKNQVEVMEIYINKSKTPEEIQKFVFQLCDIWKENVKNQCYSFYNSTGFDMIKAILKNENPYKVCAMGHLCSANVDVVQFTVFFKQFSHTISHKLSGECDDCVAKVNYFETIIGSSKTPQQIQQTMIEFCDIYVESAKQYCKIIYSSPAVLAVITDIWNHKDPKTVCQEMHECPKESLQKTPKMAPENLFVFLPKTNYGSN